MRKKLTVKLDPRGARMQRVYKCIPVYPDETNLSDIAKKAKVGIPAFRANFSPIAPLCEDEVEGMIYLSWLSSEARDKFLHGELI